MRYAIAVDLGGTKIAAALVNEIGAVIEQRNTLTQANLGRKRVIENIEYVISSLVSSQKKVKISGIGLGIPGFADTGGKVLFMPNVPLVGINIRSVLERCFRVPVHIENDSNCFALGEYFYGGHKPTVLLGVIIGTGIGSGIVTEGKLLRGCQGGAGELGHILLDVSKHISVGKNDFESFCSGPNISNRYFKLTKKRVIPKYVFTAKDPAARKIVEEEYDCLGRLLAVAVDILNPDTIVIGGGVSRSLSVEKLRKAVERYAIPFSSKFVRIRRSTLGEKAGLLGEAALVFRQ